MIDIDKLSIKEQIFIADRIERAIRAPYPSYGETLNKIRKWLTEGYYDELKDCHFCGGTTVCCIHDILADTYRIECDDCKACGPETEDAEEAIKRWNSL